MGARALLLVALAAVVAASAAAGPDPNACFDKNVDYCLVGRNAPHKEERAGERE